MTEQRKINITRRHPLIYEEPIKKTDNDVQNNSPINIIPKEHVNNIGEKFK
jgi:hypothetical protein